MNESRTPITQAYKLVEEDCSDDLDQDARYWWLSTGLALATFLDSAGYSLNAQRIHLKFIRSVMRVLGPAQFPDREPTWRSFMTDDYTPVELSWDWRTSGSAPIIRFSIEPVGIHAGTHLDPCNRGGDLVMQNIITSYFSGTNTAWLEHFQNELLDEKEAASVRSIEGHQTKIFYAFDLGKDGSIMSKAYFFPGRKASTTHQSNFDVIQDAIHTAPYSRPDLLQALKIFQEYVQDPASPPLEMDMIAIDITDPLESRIKIYFRIRETSFASIKKAMTLGGRLQAPELDRGLGDMHQLYTNLVLGNTMAGGQDDHRTAGMLYNVELKLGSKAPKVKLYLPVRHYAPTNATVLSALFRHYGQEGQTCGSSVATMAKYLHAVKTLFKSESIQSRSGLHTYLGCSVEKSGALRLVSYINPRQVRPASIQQLNTYMK